MSAVCGRKTCFKNSCPVMCVQIALRCAAGTDGDAAGGCTWHIGMPPRVHPAPRTACFFQNLRQPSTEAVMMKSLGVTWKCMQAP